MVFWVLLLLIFRLILNFLKFTGLYIGVIVFIILRTIIEPKLGLQATNGSITDNIEVIIMLICGVIAIFITIGNLIRLGNPDFSFRRLIYKK